MLLKWNYLLEHKSSRLVVLSDDPGAYDGVDPEKLSRSARAISQALNPMRQATQANKISWTLGAASGLEWAKRVFPNATSDEEAVDLLCMTDFQDLPNLRRRSNQSLGRA